MKPADRSVRRLFGLLACAVFVLGTRSLAAPSLADEPDTEFFFERRVRPVLAAYCVRCHGPEVQKANVRLDAREHILGTSGTKRVVVPGKPEESRILEVISYRGQVRMPPTGPLPKAAVEAIRRWIAAGAVWPEKAATITPTDGLAAIGTLHWAFQPLQHGPTPPLLTSRWPRSPVDLFVLERLQEVGLAPSSEASKRALCRRLYLDLIGVPPTYEQVEEFVHSNRPDAVERLVDRLLASPHYGERWGRHWLDVARYADTKGYVGANEPRYPFAYTYRDYVVRSFNEDKPYDRFVLEQLAADLLPDSKEHPEQLAALGFLTVGRRFINNIHDIIDDRIDLVGRGLLGLTLACARCHDHKYDPITMADYYALYGVFASSVEPRELPVIGPPEDEEAYAKYEAELHKRKKAVEDYFREQKEKLLAQLRRRTSDYILAAIRGVPGLDLPEDVGLSFNEDDLRPAFVIAWRRYLARRAAPEDRVFAPLTTAVRHGIEAASKFWSEPVTSELPDLNPLLREELSRVQPKNLGELISVYGRLLHTAYTESKQGDVDEATRELAEVLSERGVLALEDAQIERLFNRAVRNKLTELRRNVEAWLASGPGGPPRAMVLVDRAQPITPRIFLRGDPRRPGPPVKRRFIAVLCNGKPTPFARGSGRLELAEHIIRRDNPLTARVMANRIWMWHLGQPLVESVDDFGLRCQPPLHRELLDWLAARFMACGWSIKRLHRDIVLSATYRQSSRPRADALAVDPENRRFWRVPPRRLEFEALWDSMLAVSESLDWTIGGRPQPLFTKVGLRRRAIYGFIDRQDLAYVLRIFDFASPDSSTPRRSRTIVPQQALFFLNSPVVLTHAERLATLPDVQKPPDLNDRIIALYRKVLQRNPTEGELYAAYRAVERLLGRPWSGASDEDKNRAITAVAQVLLCSNEFAYID